MAGGKKKKKCDDFVNVRRRNPNDAAAQAADAGQPLWGINAIT